MEFRTVQLGEISEITKLAGFEFSKYIKYVEDGEIIALRAINIRNNRLNLDDIKRIYKDVSDNLVRSKLHKNDIILTYTGNGYGAAALIEEDDKFHLAPNIAKIVPKNCNPYYLFRYITSKKFQKIISNNIGGSSQPTIPMKTLRILPIEIPKIDIQNRIAKILYDIDKKIELNDQVNNNLHKLAENMFKQIYENGIDSKLSELVTNISTGSRPKGGAQNAGIPSIGAEKIEKFGVYNYTSEKYIREEYFNKLKNGIVKSGDVLLYKDGAYTGKVSMALNGFPHEKCAVNEHVFIINTKDNWAKYYLYFTLYIEENRNRIFTMASSKAAQPGLNQTELKSLDIKLADKAEIIKFEKRVDPIMFKIANNSLQNKTLERLRDTLLPKLMKGEIDLDKIEC